MPIIRVKFMVTKYISQAWNAYKKNFWQLAGALILLVLIPIGIILLTALPLFWNIMQFFTSAGLQTIPKLGLIEFLLDSSTQPFVGLFIVGVIFALIASIVLNAGFVRICADALKGRAKIGTMFSIARKKFWTILGANILAGIIKLIFLLVFLVPPLLELFYKAFGVATLIWFFAGLMAFILLAIFFSLVDQAVVIGNFRAIDSVKKSFLVVKENYLQFLVLVALLSIITFLISSIPIAGLILTLFFVTPITLLSYTAFYLHKTKAQKIKKR